MKTLFISIAIISLMSCGQDRVGVDKMIHQIEVDDQETYEADGSKINITVTLNPDASEKYRKVIFTATRGNFVDGEDGEVIKEAVKDKGIITASAQYISPLTAGNVYIKAQIDIPEMRGENVDSTLLAFQTSAPNSISLSGSAFSVYNNFDGELALTGKISNSEGNGVNLNTAVELLDLYATDFSNVDGKYRELKLKSNSSSEVSAIYTPGNVTSGQSILLIANVLDDNGGYTTGISDTLEIEIIEK